MTDPVITAVRFEDVHGRRFVHATFDDGRQERLFGFFADEILATTCSPNAATSTRQRAATHGVTARRIRLTPLESHVTASI